MNAVDFDIEVAVKVIGSLMKNNDLSLAALRAEFPHRPTTEAECSAIAQWIGQQIKTKDAKPAPSPASTPQVVDGYFAIPAGELGFSKPHFFRLKHGSPKGKWAKTQFLTEQASDENYPVRGARKAQVMHWLASNEQAARELYGTLISRCSRCNRTLTDHDNPYFPAYGPECGGK